MKYRINLIEQIRLKEKKEWELKRSITVFTLVSFVLLLLAVLYTAMNILKMKSILNAEQKKLTRIENEYKKYKATRMIINKSDIEMLDRLQTQRIYWTKKLAAMAFHLPNKLPNPYWITKFGYAKEKLTVEGFGYISPQQEQLITIDDYLNKLRADTTFSDVFQTCYLNSTVRKDEDRRQRVTFNYSAENTGARR
jgi:hypothetical protein